jgi:hypothetical protein
MVLLVILQLSPPRHSTMILCTMPSDGHWGTVHAGDVWVEDGGVHQEDKPYPVGIGVVGKGMGVGVGVGEGQCSIEDNEIEKCSIHVKDPVDL